MARKKREKRYGSLILCRKLREAYRDEMKAGREEYVQLEALARAEGFVGLAKTMRSIRLDEVGHQERLFTILGKLCD